MIRVGTNAVHCEVEVCGHGGGEYVVVGTFDGSASDYVPSGVITGEGIEEGEDAFAWGQSWGGGNGRDIGGSCSRVISGDERMGGLDQWVGWGELLAPVTCLGGEVGLEREVGLATVGADGFCVGDKRSGRLLDSTGGARVGIGVHVGP